MSRPSVRSEVEPDFAAKCSRFAIEIGNGSELRRELVIAADDIFLVKSISHEQRRAELAAGDPFPIKAQIHPGVASADCTRRA